MLNKITKNHSKVFLLLNCAFFVLCLRPPGMSLIMLFLTVIAFINLLENRFVLNYEKRFLYFYILIFLMLIRCAIGFAFNGGYEERYAPVLLLFICLLAIHLLSARDIHLSDCYPGFYYAIIISLLIVGFEIITGNHFSTSRYSDPTNDAQLWSMSKPTAFYYNENDMLSFLVCFLPFAIYHANRIWLKTLILLFTLFSAIYVGSKAAILALLIYVVFTKVISKKVIFFIGALMALIALMVSPAIVDSLSAVANNSFSRIINFWDAFSSGAGDESTSERLQIYKANISWLLDHVFALLFGNGRFGDYEMDIIKEYGLRMGEFHNLHLEMITIYGAVFYIAYFSYYISLLLKTYKLSRYAVEMKPLFSSAILYPVLISFGPSSSLKYPFLFMLTFLMIIGVKANEKSIKINV